MSENADARRPFGLTLYDAACLELVRRELPLATLDEKLGVAVISEEVAKITMPNWPGYSRMLDL
jgi:hypothetical protein